MNDQILSIFKKSAKIAGVTCLTAGIVAVSTSAAALKAIAESGKYLAKAVKDILEDSPQKEEVVDAEAVPVTEETAPAEEAAAENAE